MNGTKTVIVDEVRRLSQDEGLKDKEIAEKLGYNRVSIAKIRSKHGIPTYNLQNRKDVEVTCPQCKKIYYIRRKEKPGVCCPECAAKFNFEIAEKLEK